MTTTPLPRMPVCKHKDVQHQRRYIGDVYTRDQMQAYALAARADLEAENQRLREALQNLLNDTQHAEHPDCDDGPCPVREARAALENTK